MRFGSLLIATAASMALSCASVVLAAQVEGTATIREKMALPPGAVFEATLEDVSRADAPAEVIGRARIERPGTTPIRFRIPYDPAALDPAHSYAVRARITLGGDALFTTDRSHPVLTRGAGRRVTLLLVRVVGTAPPAPATPAPPTPEPDDPLGRLPSDFTGTVPCKNCVGVRYHLRLLSGDAFHLSTTELRSGQDVTTYDIGSWSVSSDGEILLLRGGREAPMRLVIRNGSRLRPLDPEGREISSAAEHELKRDEHAGPLEPRLSLRGMYHPAEGAGVFTECLTRKRMAVAAEGDVAALERAYSEAQLAPGTNVMASVEGRVTRRAAAAGNDAVTSLVVEKFVRLQPGDSCAARPETPNLEGTRWRPTELEGEPVVLVGAQREPILELVSKTRRVTGFGGCNRLGGTFVREGRALRLRAATTTRVACKGGTNLEGQVLRALAATRTWRVVGTMLELHGEDGARVARLEPRPPEEKSAAKRR